MFCGPGHDLDLGHVHDLGHGLGRVHGPSHGLDRVALVTIVVVEISKKEDSEKLK